MPPAGTTNWPLTNRHPKNQLGAGLSPLRSAVRFRCRPGRNGSTSKVRVSVGELPTAPDVLDIPANDRRCQALGQATNRPRRAKSVSADTHLGPRQWQGARPPQNPVTADTSSTTVHRGRLGSEDHHADGRFTVHSWAGIVGVDVLRGRCHSEPAVTVRDPAAASGRLTGWNSQTDGESPDGRQHATAGRQVRCG